MNFFLEFCLKSGGAKGMDTQTPTVSEQTEPQGWVFALWGY
ncbi:MAG: hypothetical protein ACQEXV_15455 [Bacillota bacterium]